MRAHSHSSVSTGGVGRKNGRKEMRMPERKRNLAKRACTYNEGHRIDEGQNSATLGTE